MQVCGWTCEPAVRTSSRSARAAPAHVVPHGSNPRSASAPHPHLHPTPNPHPHPHQVAPSALHLPPPAACATDAAAAAELTTVRALLRGQAPPPPRATAGRGVLKGRLLARLLRAWRSWVDATLSCARGGGRRRGGGRGREQFVVVKAWRCGGKTSMARPSGPSLTRALQRRRARWRRRRAELVS